MNDQKGQRDKGSMENNVTACDLPEILDCNSKDLTYNVDKDTYVDEGVPMMHKDSESSEYIKLEEVADIKDSRKVYQDSLIATSEEAKDDSKVYHQVGCDNSSPRDVVATSGSVSKEALTLEDTISMQDSQNHSNKNCETEHERAEEPRTNNLSYLSSELKNPLLNNVLEGSYDPHHLVFSSNFQNGLFEAESGLAHITYTGDISISGSLSVRSDGSTVSARSFAFPVLQSEWNSSPIRMVKVEKRQRRKRKGWRRYSLLLCCRF